MAGLAKQKLAGRIKWLPPKDEIYPDEPGLYKGCCDHPVVILSSRADIAGRVDFLIMTSFGGRDLAERFPSGDDRRHNHLPISPSRAHPDNDLLLS